MDLAHTFRALRHRNYRLFFVGQSISLTGTWLQQVAMSWLAYRLTDSALFLGVVAFCANISVLLFGTFAGVIADRVSRQKALLVTQGAMLVQAAVLAVLVATGRIEIWHLVVLSLWLGTVSAFDQPLRQSMYVELIPDRADLGNAIALNSLMVNGARVIGPALAGALLAFASEALCFALNALSFVAVLIAIACIRWQPREHHAAAADWWSSWLEGARYAVSFPPLRNTLLMVAALAWTLQPYSTLMPVFAKYAYAGGGAQTLGWLLSAAGFGALCAALYLARRKTIVGLGTAIVLAAMAAGAALAAFSHLHYLPAGLLLMLFVGGGTTLAAAGTNMLLQTIVEDRLRGRVAGFYTIALGGVTPLGALAAGALASSIGAPATFLINGALAALTALWFWRRLPGLRLQVRDRLVDLGVLDEA